MGPRDPDAADRVLPPRAVYTPAAAASIVHAPAITTHRPGHRLCPGIEEHVAVWDGHGIRVVG
jgi:hypothetical protein